MARHSYQFEGGDDFTTLGATWFVSYAYYQHIDKKHDNWNRVKTYPSRIKVYDKNHSLHKYWLERVLEMNPANLGKNSLGISSDETMTHAEEILNKLS